MPWCGLRRNTLVFYKAIHPWLEDWQIYQETKVTFCKKVYWYVTLVNCGLAPYLNGFSQLTGSQLNPAKAQAFVTLKAIKIKPSSTITGTNNSENLIVRVRRFFKPGFRVKPVLFSPACFIADLGECFVLRRLFSSSLWDFFEENIF